MMKQWVLLSVTALLCLSVWGTVFYQILYKPKAPVLYAAIVTYIVRSDYQPKKKPEIKVIAQTNQEVPKEKFTRIQTDLNKQLKPPLSSGIDFGDGISVDDLLSSFGIEINHN